MALFKESQKKYIESKRSYEAAFQENYLARQQMLALEKQISFFLKSNLLAELPADAPLRLERDQLVARLSSSQQNLSAAQNGLSAAREEFKAHGIQSRILSNLNDATPVLLLPLKIQTRFLTTKYIARNIPDELLVDINKVTPAQSQSLRALFPDLKPKADPFAAISSQAYSLSHNSAPGVPALISSLNQQTSTGTPKSRWQKVEDEWVLWIRIFPDDIFLHTHETAITDIELAAAKAFWQQMWDAEREFRKNGTDPTALKTKEDKQLTAWKQLRVECLAHRASWIARVMRPVDFPDNFSPDLVTIPDDKFPVPSIKSESWTLPPKTDLLPEQFTVRVYFKNPNLAARELGGAAVPDYLQLGFDPDEKEETAFAEKDQVLTLPPSIRWLTDLAEAEKLGMAIRFPLSKAEYQAGIDRLVVLGVKMGADAPEGGRLLTKLFDNHRYRPDSLAFLPQGTATNNLPGQPAGFSSAGLTDEESFRLEFSAPAAGDPRSDAQRLTTALGVDAGIFKNTANSGGKEGEEALLMNRALWPGTLGYYLDNHLRPGVTDADAIFIKSFFQNWVTARGLLPSFRIGKQPYGIVPATSWTAWKTDPGATNQENRLVKWLKKLDDQWGRLSSNVKTMKGVFQNKDEQILNREFRELLAYQASSTRYFRRLVAGENLLWNINYRNDPAGAEKAGIRLNPGAFKTKLESATAWNEPVHPRTGMLGKFFDDENYKLTDQALEDADVATPLLDNGMNYLGLLPGATLEQLKNHTIPGFSQFVVQRTSRLLFYMARFSLLQGWVSAAVNLVQLERQLVSPLARLDFEMEYVLGGTGISNEHRSLLQALGVSNSTFETRKGKWAFFEEVLGSGKRVDSTILEKMKEPLYLFDLLGTLKEVMASLTELASLPINRLERLSCEHIDLCSYRLDAWLQGLVLSRLGTQRKKAGFEKGIYIGAYGYLENLQPGLTPWVQVQEIKAPPVIVPGVQGNENAVMPVFDFSTFKPAQIATIKKQVFVYLGSDPATALQQALPGNQLVQVPAAGATTGEGFVLTPSLEHAATASILRAGYEHHSLSQGTGSATLATNLDATRTGQAVDMLKAVNKGHSLNEQLGYFIERRMYDNLALAQYVPDLRTAFPLHIERNEWDDYQQINEAAKITNLELVTDGLAIVNKHQQPLTVPTWSDKLTAVFKTDQPAKEAFEKVVGEAGDQFDAVSDLVLAESVFQTVKGNPDRAAAALRIASEGSDILLPEIAQVPAESRVLTHRMGFVLNAPDAPERTWSTNQGTLSLAARLSPDLNRWLADQLPLPAKIVAWVRREDNAGVKIGLGSLGIQAIDFYYLLQKVGGRPQDSGLNWLFTEAARKLPGMDAKGLLEVSFQREPDFAPDEFAVQELMPLIRTIGALLEKSRPLRPQDWLVPAETGTPGTAELYENTALLAVCRAFSETGEKGPIPFYMQKLDAARQTLE
ncbi:MAG: hypothetical protein INR73_18725 [Williamsia sp.]|nr:hypothetical protein [Williamsia sp.]